MPGSLAYRLYRFTWEILDWVYPPTCGGCGAQGVRWCPACSQETVEVAPPVCAVCGNHNLTSSPCQRCQSEPPHYSALRSFGVFKGPLREAIHQLKYKRNIGLGEVLARPMIDSLRKLNWSLDIITSVPLGLVRLKERGYNQATLLAKPIALYLKIPFSTQVLSRVRETQSQVGLTVNERQQNMAGAFQAKGSLVQGKTILVVDDVATSGATLNSCAQALLSQGASKVYGFSLARAVYSPEGHLDIS